MLQWKVVATKNSMKELEYLIEDPIIQLMGFVILSIGIYDAFKFALSIVWRMIGGKGNLDD